MIADWREQLAPLLAQAAKVAVLGVGSELKSDDAAGMELIAQLRRASPPPERVLLLAGSTAPENFTGEIGAFAPDLLLIVDAARLGLAPGGVALLDEAELGGPGFATHMLPLSVLLAYLRRQGLAEIRLLGIEPASLDFGLTLTPEVAAAVARIRAFLLAQWGIFAS